MRWFSSRVTWKHPSHVDTFVDVAYGVTWSVQKPVKMLRSDWMEEETEYLSRVIKGKNITTIVDRKHKKCFVPPSFFQKIWPGWWFISFTPLTEKKFIANSNWNLSTFWKHCFFLRKTLLEKTAPGKTQRMSGQIRIDSFWIHGTTKGMGRSWNTILDTKWRYMGEYNSPKTEIAAKCL